MISYGCIVCCLSSHSGLIICRTRTFFLKLGNMFVRFIPLNPIKRRCCSIYRKAQGVVVSSQALLTALRDDWLMSVSVNVTTVSIGQKGRSCPHVLGLFLEGGAY